MCNKGILIGVLVILAHVNTRESIHYGQYRFDETGPMLNLLPPIRDENQPRKCDASLFFAITTAMSAHMNIYAKGAFPEVVLSPQMLINLLPENIPFRCND